MYVKQSINTVAALHTIWMHGVSGDWWILIKPINCVFQFLLSGDETLQATSAKCIASVLVHSPSRCSAPFIKADVPGDMHTQWLGYVSYTSCCLIWFVFYKQFPLPSSVFPFDFLSLSKFVLFLLLSFCVSLFILVSQSCFFLYFYVLSRHHQGFYLCFSPAPEFRIRWGFHKRILPSFFVYHAKFALKNITPLPWKWYDDATEEYYTIAIFCSLFTLFY